jgi:hypothetical protein
LIGGDAHVADPVDTRVHSERVAQLHPTPDPVVIVDDAAAIRRVVWHCGGYVKDKQKHLYCSFVLIDQPSELASLRRKQFPDIDDGGTSVCNCSFSLKTGHIVRLEWNGEA